MIEHRFIDANGLRFHVATAGPEDGPLIVLLHGFPEFWFGWRRQIDDIASAGYRVWAPDQRGYNLSDKPNGAASYAIDHLAADIIGLIDAAGAEQAVVVGHDWGGAVAWHLAAKYPKRVAKVAILNVPHPEVMLRHLRRGPCQLLRSSYIFFFQLPALPEWWLGFRHGGRLAQKLRHTSRAGAFSDDELAKYGDAWSQPGAMTGMLNWYRAAMRHPSPDSYPSPIEVPVLLIWGSRDAFLGQEMAQPSIERCLHGRLEVIGSATHWVHLEEAERINRLIIEFLAAPQ